ncbi:DUF1697 domain-containing protein [Aquimarina sp. 2201CG5-10]|uniref:DUF1697 domain-containing protein n=1 Tax=Aquimarina callyspongiae TaxID=3098150 RepID=UPI002AB530DB|nr:DUF1697 domain-containing protein [Aquimarina sp. 2201CG5-10]MDY8134792.1 DUF1697 domain-containing protein [Aquimarina sp. 2201CG5-10]
MNTYIALLRGINVSGQKKILMADLKRLFEALGFVSVTTYIQSGNVVFQDALKNTTDLETIVKEGIQKHFGFDVPVLVIKPKDLQLIYKNNPFSEKITNGKVDPKKMFFTFLSKEPESALIKELPVPSDGEEFVIVKKVIYFYAANGYGKTRLNNNFFERKMKCNATTRNLKTVIKMLEISSL